MADGTAALAEKLGMARLEGRPLPPLQDSERPRGEEEGYAAQAALAAWFDGRDGGARRGYKIGATSLAMQEFLGLPGPSYGRVRASGLHASGATVAVPGACPLGVEAEIALILGRDIVPRERPWTAEELAPCVAAVAPAFEIVENRYGDLKSTGLGTLIADDFLHRGCVLGEQRALEGDLSALIARVTVAGADPVEGTGAAALGHPLNALAWLANTLGRQGLALREGEVVLTGAMTGVHWLEALPGEASCQLDGFAPVTVRLERA